MTSIIGPAAANYQNTGWFKAYRSESAIVVSENTASSVILDTYTMPGGLLGPDSMIKLSCMTTDNSSANPWGIFVYFTGGKMLQDQVVVGQKVLNEFYMWNDHSITSQKGLWNVYQANVNSGNTRLVDTEDTSGDLDFTLRCTTGAGDQGVVEWWMVEIMI